MSPLIQIMLIMIFVSIGAAILGNFLILKQSAMLVDAITHTILLGIVLAFFITKDLTSPLLIGGAALMGIVTVFLIERLTNTGLVSEDASIGIIFPLLFSIAILLITLKAENVHLDVDTVLLGKVELSPFDTWKFRGKNMGSVNIYMSGIIALINIVFVSLFYKELKLSTFDPGFAKAVGLNIIGLHYLLMTLVSVTTVASFQAVGSILVIAFVVGPPATAYLLSKKLSKMIKLSVFFGIVSSILGTLIAFHFDLSIAGTTAAVIGILFAIVFLLSPEEGLAAKARHRKRQKQIFQKMNILFHLYHHETLGDWREESQVETMNTHLRLPGEVYEELLDELRIEKFIQIEAPYVIITELGREYLMSTAKDWKLFEKLGLFNS